MSIDVAFEPVRPKLESVVPPENDDDAITSPPDPLSLIETLEAERRATHGEIGHPHAGPGCGFCRRAAAVYSV